MFSAGDKVANAFELLRPLDGAAGRVWLARETALLRDVALKFQRGPDDASRAALAAEAEILSRCDHPSLVAFYRSVNPDGGNPAFYAMKAMTSSLADRIASGDAPAGGAVLRMGGEIAGALACLHGMSPPVAHGGVAPENTLFDVGGRAVLGGFGSARRISGDGDSASSAEDVHALGLLLRDALGGRVPYRIRSILRGMLADNPAERPSAADVERRLAASSVRGLRPALVAAGSALALTAALFTTASAGGGGIVDEVHSPTVTSLSHTLATRLPALSSAAVGRIPWYHLMQSFDRKIPGIEAYGRRYNEFAAAHPNWENPRRDVCAGAQRLIRLPGGVQLELAAVPAGFFRRGFFLSSNSPDRAECLVTPQSVLISRPFWMARTELTRAQYAAVMRVAPAVEGHRARRLPLWEGRGGRPLMVEGGDLPVGEDLDLADVLRFIDALNALCGLEGERRFRLPTEAEWEHACRAFVGRRYEGEPDPGDAAWTVENSGGVPHGVASKAQNPLGLFDMHGNLSEWCADAYGPLPDWAPFDPVVAPTSNSAPRVVRGGSFRDARAACDSDARAPALPTDKGHAIRLVAGP